MPIAPSPASVKATNVQSVTIATGVATITDVSPVLLVVGEGAANDQLDTLTVTNTPPDGYMMTLISDGSDTITVDDANIDLAAATRAIAPGGALVLRYDGTSTQWAEVAFTAAADNV